MGWLKIQKTWISWERNIIFLQNKNFFDQCLRWHILRSYRFVVEVTFNTHLTYLFEIAYWLLAYSWIFRWEISQSWCNSMLYGIFTNFRFFCDTPCPVFATFFNAFLFLTQLFSNFFFFICKIQLHSWYHLRFWHMLEIFGDGRHFDFLLSSVVCFDFDYLHQTWRAQRFEYSSKRWNYCIAKQFWKHIVAEIQSLKWKWSHLLPHLLVHVVGIIKSRHGKI